MDLIRPKYPAGFQKTASEWLFNVINHLPQVKTNGKSLLGTLASPLLPLFLTDNPLPYGYPWGRMTAANTNYYQTTPDNDGKTRYYDFELTRGIIAPDGYEREVLLVNGQFPGPTIHANWGDWIEVTVTNNISGGDDDEKNSNRPLEWEGSALHWHGFLQKGTVFQDGVPGVSQCPIAPGRTNTYRFQATLYGTSWYHSHYSAQWAGGLFGPIVVYGPRAVKYDYDLGPVLLSDWYHDDYFTLLEETLAANGSGLVFSDNNLINGKNNFDCRRKAAGDKTRCTNKAGISRFRFRKGKTHRLRLINAGTEALQRFSIDGHTMTVIANDFVTIEPYDTKVVTLGIGQRTDVLVKATGQSSTDSFWIRANMSVPCSLTNQPYALGVIYYENAGEHSVPKSQPWDVPDPGTCANDDLELTKPYYEMELPPATSRRDMEIDLSRNASGVPLWTFDGVSMRTDYNTPTGLQVHSGNLTFEKEWNVRNFGSSKSVRIVVSNNSPAAHPIHIHGFNMYVLNEGPGLTWDGTVVYAPNPQRRDVQMVRAGGYIAIQFDAAGNPGLWPFHCHIAWHASGGLLVQLVTQPKKIQKLRVPKDVYKTCRHWRRFTERFTVDQIDSGLSIDFADVQM
ncbi:hypothetical protein ACHAQA_008639 [Verticillium albo-atrum]